MEPRPVLLNPRAEAIGRTNVVLWGRGGRGPYHVRDFPGSLSIKTVVRGEGIWETHDGRFRVDPGSYLVLNHGRRYSLTIESRGEVETFCVFFRRGFVEAAGRALGSPEERLLDDPEGEAPREFAEAVRPREGRLRPAVEALYAGVARPGATDLWLEERFLGLAEALLLAERDVRAQAARLPARRASTRVEVLRRLLRARDFLEASIEEPVTLERAAGAACLSPFHFHRQFRSAFGETPRVYLTRRRLERARDLLERTEAPVADVCFASGFRSLGSFTALFRRRFGLPPARFRRTRAEKSKLGEEPGPPSRGE